MTKDKEGLATKLHQALASNKRLALALRKFGTHWAECKVNRPGALTSDSCNCGFRAALRQVRP